MAANIFGLSDGAISIIEMNNAVCWRTNKQMTRGRPTTFDFETTKPVDNNTHRLQYALAVQLRMRAYW